MSLEDSLGKANKNAQDVKNTISATDQAILNAVKSSAQLTAESRNLTEELKDQLGIRSKQNEGEKVLLGVSRDITKSAQENKVALGQQGDISKQIVKEENQILAAKREQLIVQNGLSSEQISQAQQITTANKIRLETLSKIDELQSKLVDATESERVGILSSINGYQDRLAANEASLDAVLSSADVETQRLALANQLVEKAQENLAVSENEAATQNEIEAAMGLTGAALATLNGLAGPFAKSLGMDKVKKDMEAFAEESIRAGKKVSRLQTLGVGVKSAFGSLAKTLTDPSVIITKILKDYGEFEKANKEVRQLTGQTANNYSSFNGSLVSATDQVKTIGSLSKELGINVNAAFSPDTILAATELTELLGLGVKETAQLSMNAEAFGQDLSTFPKSAERVTKQFALSGKGALNMGDVLKEAGSASGALSLSLEGNPDALVKAAAGAKALGLSLAQAEGIADSLLDFESSIQAEMEAELLTGKSLNLEKARSAALNNDIAGLTEEIGNNQEILSAFSSGNRIEQAAVAKSLGMSKDEVAKMIVLQKINSNMTTQQAADAVGISIEEAKRLSTQDQINKSIEKMTTAFAPILNFFASILSNSVVLYGTLTAIAAVMTVKMLGGAREFASEMKDSVQSTADMAKNLASGFAEGEGFGGKIMGAAKGALGLNETPEVPELPDVEAISATPGDQIQNSLTGLADGLKAMGDGKVFAGIGAVALAGPAFILALPSIPFLVFMAVGGKAAGKGLEGLGKGLAKMGGSAGPALPAIGIIALLGAAMIPFAFSLRLITPLIEAFGNIIIGVFSTLPPIISAVAEGFVSILGAVSPENILGMVMLGPALISASVGMVAFGLALAAGGIGSFFGGGILDQIKELSTVGPGVAAAGAGLAAVAGNIDIISLSMQGLSESIQAISLSLLGLGGLASPLFALAGGLMSISTGLAAIAVSGIFALPIFAALKSVAVVAPVLEKLGKLFNVGDSDSESADADSTGAKGSSVSSDITLLAEKLDQMNLTLNALLVKEGTVTLDGSKVGTALTVGSYKLQ